MFSIRACVSGDAEKLGFLFRSEMDFHAPNVRVLSLCVNSRATLQGQADRDDVAASRRRQSELAVNAVFDSVPSHFFDSLMALAIAFFSKRNQILKVNA